MLCKAKRDVHVVLNICHPLIGGNIYADHGNAIKPAVVKNYNKTHTHIYMKYNDKND
jgi:hypothetical protein